MPQHVVEQVLTILAGIERPVVAALGLAYKADVDDARESPAITVIRWLQASGCEVRAYDPHVANGHSVRAVDSLEMAVEGTDCLLVLTKASLLWVVGSLVASIVIARVLGPDLAGEVNYITWLTATVGLITGMALPETLLRYQVELKVKSNSQEVKGLHQWVNQWFTVTTLIGVVDFLGLFRSGDLPGNVGQPKPLSPPLLGSIYPQFLG